MYSRRGRGGLGCSTRMGMRIALTGGGGLVGRAVAAEFRSHGHLVRRLVRPPSCPRSGEIVWDPEAGSIDIAGLEGIDAVVHLAGEPLTALRWTGAKKRAIYESRVSGTILLASALAQLQNPPAVFVSQSAVGFYGNRGDEILQEDSCEGTGFLANVASAWERATHEASANGIRVVHLRGAPVVASRSPFVTRLLPAFRLGLGGRFGSGRQWWPWISLSDVVGIVSHVIRHQDVRGPVNVVSPEILTNRQFAATLGRVLGRPAFIPLVSPVLQTLMGDVARDMLLSSQRAVPLRLLSSGYQFRFPILEAALRYALD